MGAERGKRGGGRQGKGRARLLGLGVAAVFVAVIGGMGVVVWLGRAKRESTAERAVAASAPAPAPTVSPVPTPIPPGPNGETNYTETAGGLDLEMVWVPPGSFMMGSPESEKGRFGNEGPQHRVTLDGFWMGKYELNLAQWITLMQIAPFGKQETGRIPVHMVSWNEATEFCKRLSALTGKGYQLPTEAQWEYACRAGTQTSFSFGDDDTQLGRYSWFARNANLLTHAIGDKEPNPWGLYDMYGNVSEWCADLYLEHFIGFGPGPIAHDLLDGDERVFRGGSWPYAPRLLRSAARNYGKPTYREGYLGLRVSRLVEADGPIESLSPALSQPLPARTSQAAAQAAAGRYDELAHNVHLAMRLIPAGSFAMGSPEGEEGREGREGPQHTVKLDAFWLSECEITNEDFEAFVNMTGYQTDAEWLDARHYSGQSRGVLRNIPGTQWRHPQGPESAIQGLGRHPVVQISWNDAKSFCAWLSGAAGRNYDLPTEAQWEYACRARSTTAYCWGNDPNDGDGWCNAADASFEQAYPSGANGARQSRTFLWKDGYVMTAPVCTFRANAFGLYDMHGNVLEWCEDGYKEGYTFEPPAGENSYEITGGNTRVIRGGSWSDGPNMLRAAFRYGQDRFKSNGALGFRVARNP